ncbi:Tex-like N-terminal domain-containing protein [Bacillus sp. B6(2022)]|nr:Tex-like N-terminal domain-containing protein [Bacillus sp. B6(2022)]
MKTSDFLLKQIATELKLSTKQIGSVIQLLEDGNTVPFIARYRKEQTGSLDEVQIQTISERYTYIQNVTNRKEEVIRLIAEQDKLTDELKQKIEQAHKLQEVEDLYRPFKQKRKTKANVAKAKGLEPLAEYLLQLPNDEIKRKHRLLSMKKKKSQPQKKH